MVLVQILLPVTVPGHPAAEIQEAFARTRGELVEAFGGVTAYMHASAEGIWTTPDGARDVDRVVMVEVVAPAFDRRWWQRYVAVLAGRFSQDTVHVRSLPIDVVDPRAV
jgi:hypothetical protein